MKKVTVKMNSKESVSAYLLDSRNVVLLHEGILKIVGVELKEFD